MKKILLFLVFFISCNNFAQKTEIDKFNILAKNYHEKFLKLNPLEATMQGDFRYNNKLPNNISKKYLRNYKKFYEKTFTLLKFIDYSQLDEKSQISYDVLKHISEQELEKLSFQLEQIPFTQFRGEPLILPILGSGKGAQPFNSVKDYENWISRVHDFTKWSHTAIKNFRKGQKSGMVLPKVLVNKMIDQLSNEQIISPDFEKNIFYSPIKNFPASFSEKEKNNLTMKYQKMITHKIIPTYTLLTKFLKDEYLASARDTYGYSSLPNGDKMYSYWLKRWTTTDKTPDEFYRIGLKQVDSLKREMNKIKEELGYQGSLKDFLSYAKKDPKTMPFKTPEEVTQAFYDILYKIEPKLKTMFNTFPKTAFEVRQTEKFKEKSASPEYYRGSADGKRPAIFYVPIPDATKFSKAIGMEAIFLHEAIPGHHYEISLQQENTSLPSFMRFYSTSAFREGWALYCESLGKDLGLYTDPYEKLGALSVDMMRAVRLVIDTGIHTRNMNREEAIQYFIEHVTFSDEAAVAEIERYMSLPGQALSYKAGALKIFELREKYKKRLGNKFNLASFHEAVVDSGCLPLNILEKKMDKWAEKTEKM